VLETDDEVVTLDEPEPEEKQKKLEVNKYELLDKLFTFIRTEETPLNPVLSGYF
jgi:hypothetical protein